MTVKFRTNVRYIMRCKKDKNPAKKENNKLIFAGVSFYLSHTNTYFFENPHGYITLLSVHLQKEKTDFFAVKSVSLNFEKNDTICLCSKVTFCIAMQYREFDLFNMN